MGRGRYQQCLFTGLVKRKAPLFCIISWPLMVDEEISLVLNAKSSVKGLVKKCRKHFTRQCMVQMSVQKLWSIQWVQ